MTKFVCSICQAEKSPEEFYRRNDRPVHTRSSRNSRCKQCLSNKEKNPERRAIRAEITRRSNAKLKHEVFSHYSNGLMECSCCGENQFKFLTLDHVEGGGREHREQLGSPAMVYRDLRTRNFPSGFQILCYNCNCGRSQNNGVCPHKNKE